MILNSMGIVTVENRVVITIIIVAYSFLKLKVCANIGVIAAEGIAAKIITELETMDFSFINIEITISIAGINIILMNMP